MMQEKRSRKQVQNEAKLALENNEGSGQLIIATGVGKTKIAIDQIMDLLAEGIEPKDILLANFYVKLLEIAWKEEFIKWGGTEEIYNQFTKSTYVSLNKIKDRSFKLIVMDEAHHITENSIKFFSQNLVERIIILTATRPLVGDEKRGMLDSLAPVVFQYGIKDAVSDSNVSPFDICLIAVPLDNTNKYIKAGNKLKPFFVTEKTSYDYTQSLFIKNNIELKEAKEAYNLAYHNGENTIFFRKKYDSLKKLASILMFKRLHFIYGLKSKTNIAARIMQDIFNSQERSVVFCGSIEQANNLCKEKVYHSKSKDESLKEFIAEKSNLLGVVNSLNEGMNIPKLDRALVVQINSKELHITQRIGRLIRFRPDYRAEIIILYAEGTQDAVWLKKSLETFDKSIIKHFNSYDKYLAIKKNNLKIN